MTITGISGLRDQLTRQRDQLRADCESSLADAQRSGRGELNATERAMLNDLRGLDRRVADLSSELDRAGYSTGIAARLTRQLGTASRLAPLGFDTEQLRRLQTAAQRGESARLESRAGFSTAESLLPAELWPYPIGQIHEARLLDSLPGVAMETASIEFVRHTSTTGAAAPTGEGAAKPEVVFNTDALTAHAVKLAAHNGLSWEIVNDWPSFQSHCGSELYKQIIDVENA
jgi:HK97 family phage major capsid protein